MIVLLSKIYIFNACLMILVVTLGVDSSIPTPEEMMKLKMNPHHLISKLHEQIRAKEEELKRAEAINKNFERMIQLVNILGQVDNFLTERTKTIIKKLAVLVDDEDDSSDSRSEN